MRSALAVALLSAAVARAAADAVLGAFVFHRHGDRTPKALAPAKLTALGYAQVYDSGQFFRARYLAQDSPDRLLGLSTDNVNLAQLAVSAPVDSVLQSSAAGFVQGLYPPVGGAASAQTLANGSSVQAPLNGFQLVPVNAVAAGAGSEDSTWLQDATGCRNAQLSSNAYFSSSDYQRTLQATQPLYQSLVPVVNGTLAAANVSFKNAYSGACARARCAAVPAPDPRSQSSTSSTWPRSTTRPSRPRGR